MGDGGWGGPRIETLTDVPADQVDDIVASFERDGATNVTRTEQPNGKFTVTAEFPE